MNWKVCSILRTRMSEVLVMETRVKHFFDEFHVTLIKTHLPFRAIFHICSTEPATKRVSTKGLIGPKEVMHSIKSRAYRDAH